MKKGEKKVIKNEDKPDEVVVAEKVIDTSPKVDKNIVAMSAAIYNLEEKQKEILKKVNHICTRLGLSKV